MTTYDAVQLPLLVPLGYLANVIPNDAQGMSSDDGYEDYELEEMDSLLWECKLEECTEDFIDSIKTEGIVRPLRIQDPSTVLPGTSPLLYNGHHRIAVARKYLSPDTLIPVLFEDPYDGDSIVSGTRSYPENPVKDTYPSAT